MVPPLGVRGKTTARVFLLSQKIEATSYFIGHAYLTSNHKPSFMKEIIKTEKAPAPIGPYNQAIFAGETLYMSGQIAINPESGQMVQDTIEAETHQVMQNMKAVLEAAELEMIDIVKTSIFIMDMADFSRINEVYGSYFEKGEPARETVQVAALPKNARVEISCIATKSGW